MYALDAEPLPRTLRVLSPEEWRGDVAPESIVEGMIFEGSTHLLTGASKTGKTYLVAQLVMCTVSGTPFLGLEVRRASVLFLSLELSAGMLRTRIEKVGADTGLPIPAVGPAFAVVAPTSDYVPRLDISTEDGRSTLREIIAETAARVVILDTLYRFTGGADPNSNAEMSLIFGGLNTIAQETGSALVLVDHVAKGEQLGPTSHSALGAQVKGGASRVIIGLKRTSKESGGSWEVNVESHFGSWDEPLHYERPKREDGERGFGCVLCSASEAHGLDFAALERVFQRHGLPDGTGRPAFSSARKLIEALIAEKHATGNADGQVQVRAIRADHCRPEGAVWGDDRPIETSTGKRNATVFTWRMAS